MSQFKLHTSSSSSFATPFATPEDGVVEAASKADYVEFLLDWLSQSTGGTKWEEEAREATDDFSSLPEGWEVDEV